MPEQTPGPERAGLPPTPSQTVGPWFGMRLPYAGDSHVAPAWLPGAIELRGRVLDGAGDPVPDAVIELWQPDAQGRIVRKRGSLQRTGADITGFGRCATDADGAFRFTTVKPGALREGLAPFVSLAVYARGLLDQLYTRAYFGDERERNEADPTLSSLDPARRDTLIAVPDGPSGYRFDIRIQGGAETVFFDFGIDV
jgi:protocatechuate 3,4-dioxygenase, alpha subunit